MTSLIEVLGPPTDEQARQIVAAWTRGHASTATPSPPPVSAPPAEAPGNAA